jgi:hypothetical protein
MIIIHQKPYKQNTDLCEVVGTQCEILENDQKLTISNGMEKGKDRFDTNRIFELANRFSVVETLHKAVFS